METIKQKHGFDCGQCAIAMLTEKTYNEAVEAVGHVNSTKTKDLIKAIEKLGEECEGDRLKTLNFDIETLGRALVKVTYSWRSGWHWIAVIQGEIYDPSWRDSLRTGRATSYLVVW